MLFPVFRMFDLHLKKIRQLTSPLNYRPTACATVFLQIFNWNLMWNNVNPLRDCFKICAKMFDRKCQKKRRIGRRNRPGKVCRKCAPKDVFQTEMLENWFQRMSCGTGSQKRQLFPKLCHNHENHVPLFIFSLIRTFDKQWPIQIHAEVFPHVPQNKEGEDRVSSCESLISNLERGQGVFVCAISWLKNDENKRKVDSFCLGSDEADQTENCPHGGSRVGTLNDT